MMSLHISITKSAPTKLRKLPFLPRFALTVELGGRQLTLRKTPALETLLNLRQGGFTLANLRKVAEEELAEIKLPALRKPVAAVAKKGLAQVKTIKEKVVANAKPIRKAAAKAALKKRPDEGEVIAPGTAPAN
jgi:hypothetical protein